MKKPLAVIIVLAAAGLFATIEMVSCTQVKTSLPGTRWTRTAPEHLGLRFEKIDQQLQKIQPEAAASAIERLGYLVWDRGNTNKAIVLPDALATTMAKLSDGNDAMSLARKLGFEAAADLGGETDAFISANAKDLLRLGLLLLQKGSWGEEILATEETTTKLLADESLWKSGKSSRGNLHYLAAGDPSVGLLILFPEIDTVMAVVAKENAPLAEPATYADLLSTSFRPVW